MSTKRQKTVVEPREGLAAIAFDIDGVFKYGREWSADGMASLRRITAAGVPYVFVTNGGGGLTEQVYAAGFASKVASAEDPPAEASAAPPMMDEGNMILSYSPWRAALGADYADAKVLLVGDPREKVLEVAESYGLRGAVHYADYASIHETINPFRQAASAGTSHTAVANAASPHPGGAKARDAAKRAKADDDAEKPFAAVLVVCDPYNWFEALQVIVDILCSPQPTLREYDAAAPTIPVHFSNPDVLWKAQHPFPRFGQGAFKIALRALYLTRLRALRVPEETHDEKVAASFRQWGKPTDATFRFVEDRLRRLSPAGAADGAQRFYMVGDNPASDMEGVRRANIYHRAQAPSGSEQRIRWAGVLVRTGVFKDGDETNGADTVVHGVAEAVDWILKAEGRD